MLGYSISYGLFGIALLGIDLGIAYATWSSVGIIVTSCVGYLYYKQKLTKIGYISLLAAATGLLLIRKKRPLKDIPSLRDRFSFMIILLYYQYSESYSVQSVM